MTHQHPHHDRHATRRRTAGRSARALLVPLAIAAMALTGCSNGLQESPDSGEPALSAPSDAPTSSPSASGASAPGDPAPSSSPASDSSPGAAPSSGSASSSGSSPGNAGASSGSDDGESPGVAVCPASDLAVGTRVPDGAGAAGTRYLLLTFRNESGRACFLDGHPGVSFVGRGDGTQLGDPAERSGGLQHVLLEPGDDTAALLAVTRAGNYDPEACAPTTADGFRVYPPDSRASVFVPFEAPACQRSLGDRHQLVVSAVGDDRT